MEKKRIAAIAASAALAITLAGCGGSSQPSSSATTPEMAALEESAGQFLYTDDVHGDKTGNWHCFTYHSASEPVDIASAYASAYGVQPGEVHALVNLGTKVSANLTTDGSVLYVDEYEYVQGEENDAEKMFTGQALSKYIVHLDSGEIEKL